MLYAYYKDELFALTQFKRRYVSYCFLVVTYLKGFSEGFKEVFE